MVVYMAGSKETPLGMNGGRIAHFYLHFVVCFLMILPENMVLEGGDSF